MARLNISFTTSLAPLINGLSRLIWFEIWQRLFENHEPAAERILEEMLDNWKLICESWLLTSIYSKFNRKKY